MTDVRAGIVAEPVDDVTAVLGEGPYWIPEDSCLLWVDIPAGLLHRTDMPSGIRSPPTSASVSAAFPADGGGILYTGGNQVALFAGRARHGEWTSRTIAQAPARDGLRFNDASVDPAGRLWVGSMDMRGGQAAGRVVPARSPGQCSPRSSAG